jgi:Na+/H+ antiporter NhaD/arsenite permease-like protein
MLTLVLLIIFFAVFYLIFVDKVDRFLGVVYGAAATLFMGAWFDFFNEVQVYQSISFETLFLMFGMMLYSDSMAQTGIFRRCAFAMARLAKNDPWLILVLFSCVTYLLSLFINNLTTIVIIVPITIALCASLGVRPIPVVVSEVIASNLGGASSMVGDFPNMLISASTSLNFMDFISHMLPACLLGMGLLFAIVYFRKEPLVLDKPIENLNPDNRNELFDMDEVVEFDWKIYGGILIFFGMVGLFIFSEDIEIRPPVIAVAGGVLTMFVVASKKVEVLRDLNYKDIAFFFFLFIMVGGIQASGLLNNVSFLTWELSNGNHYVQAILMMISASFLTIFLNAGPATSLFIPIAADFTNYADHSYIWWALSLGVCAGSSAAITGATSGTLASNYLAEHAKKMGLEGKEEFKEYNLNFNEFLGIGLPFMGLFLLLSAIYLIRYL